MCKDWQDSNQQEVQKLVHGPEFDGRRKFSKIDEIFGFYHAFASACDVSYCSFPLILLATRHQQRFLSLNESQPVILNLYRFPGKKRELETENIIPSQHFHKDSFKLIDSFNLAHSSSPSNTQKSPKQPPQQTASKHSKLHHYSNPIQSIIHHRNKHVVLLHHRLRSCLCHPRNLEGSEWSQ